jgi:hypothetical protein
MNTGSLNPDDYRRYALYAAPAADGLLGRFGNAWLGRDPSSLRPLAYPAVPGYDSSHIARLTAQPAKYGFHATLKAPFHLRDGMTFEGLCEAVSDTVGGLKPVDVGLLRVSSIGTFVALVPGEAVPALEDLAATLVKELDGFRQSPSDAEIARRRLSSLTVRQEALLARWGYPYVLEEFRFHFTLSGSLPQAEQTTLAQALYIYTKDLLPAYRIEDIAVFGELANGDGFRLLKRIPLGG